MVGIIKKTGAWYCVLWFFVFCFFAVVGMGWWFHGDDFSGLALGKAMQSWDAFWAHLVQGNVNKYFFPSHHPLYVPFTNEHGPALSFFQVYYRPVQCAYFAFAHWAFGYAGYYYFLVNVALHACNTTVLFAFLRKFTTTWWALGLALFFALHPQIGYRFGTSANFQYYLNVLLMLALVWAYKKYLDSGLWSYLVWSVVFFFLALFTRETAIVLPPLLWLGAWVYTKRFGWSAIVHGMVALFYLAVRLAQYPLPAKSAFGGGGLNVVQLLLERKDQFLVCLYDSLGLSWLLHGSKGLRVMLVVGVAAIVVMAWRRHAHSLALFFLLGAYVLLLWPSCFGAYSPRYFYEASPALLAFFALLRGKQRVPFWVARFGVGAGGVFIVLCAYFIMINISCRAQKMTAMHDGFCSLMHDTRVTSGERPLVFVGVPIDGFGTGIEWAAWLFLTPLHNQVYYDPCTMLTQYKRNVIMPAGWYMRCAPYYEKQYVAIAKEGRRIRFCSVDPALVHFIIQPQLLSLGEYDIHKKMVVDGVEVVVDFTLVLDELLYKKNPLVITWNYEHKKCYVLE